MADPDTYDPSMKIGLSDEWLTGPVVPVVGFKL